MMAAAVPSPLTLRSSEETLSTSEWCGLSVHMRRSRSRMPGSSWGTPDSSAWASLVHGASSTDRKRTLDSAFAASWTRAAAMKGVGKTTRNGGNLPQRQICNKYVQLVAPPQAGDMQVTSSQGQHVTVVSSGTAPPIPTCCMLSPRLRKAGRYGDLASSSTLSMRCSSLSSSCVRMPPRSAARLVQNASSANGPSSSNSSLLVHLHRSGA